MNICIFDTETTYNGTEDSKPYCYNIGYVIIDTDSWTTLFKRSFIVEQIWHNRPLFNTEHYNEKRPIYIAEMRKHTTEMSKYGYICQQMLRDFKNYEIEHAYAYNSNYDDEAFKFNCDWFKCSNPFDNVEIHDIMGFVHHSLIDGAYKKFCDDNKLYTKFGNYSTTAEDVYRCITADPSFVEAHTALADSIIEAEILKKCLDTGKLTVTEQPKAYKHIYRKQGKTLCVRNKFNKKFYFPYDGIYINDTKTEVCLH